MTLEYYRNLVLENLTQEELDKVVYTLDRHLLKKSEKLILIPISFTYPLKNPEVVKRNDPKGYALLQEYLELEAIYQKLKTEQKSRLVSVKNTEDLKNG